MEGAWGWKTSAGVGGRNREGLSLYVGGRTGSDMSGLGRRGEVGLWQGSSVPMSLSMNKGKGVWRGVLFTLGERGPPSFSGVGLIDIVELLHLAPVGPE